MEPTTKRVKKHRCDWDRLKIEFMESDYPTMQKFIKVKGIPWNGNTAHKTSGWIKEKKGFSKKLAQDTFERTEKKIEEKAEIISNKISSEITEILKRQGKIADLLLARIEDITEENRQVYGVIKGRKIIGKLNPSNILSLSRAAVAASELQRVAKGISNNEPGTDTDDREDVQQSILDRIRSRRNPG